MALIPKYVGFRNALCLLASAEFTRQNYGASGQTSTTITESTPNGVLAGMVAAVGANDYEVKVAVTAAGADKPLGIFLHNSSDSPFQNQPAVASGKVTYVHGLGSYLVNYYETSTEAAAPQTYALGDKLYYSKNGLLTKDPTTAGGANAVVIGIVTKRPGTDGWLGFDLKI